MIRLPTLNTNKHSKRSKPSRETRGLYVSGDFGILLAVLLFLDTNNLVPLALLACFLHEVGHALAIRGLGGRIVALRLTAVGAEMIPQRGRMFSYGEELVIALAGPGFSILTAILFALLSKYGLLGESGYLFSGLNLAAGVFNLLPAGPLDGGRVVKALIMKHGGVVEAELWHHRISAGIALLVCMLGVYHVYIWGGNLTLLLTGGWLLLGAKQAVL